MAKTPPFFMPGTVEKWQNPRLCLAQIGPRLGLPKARPQHPDMVQEGGLLVMFFGLSHYCNLANYGKSH